MPDAPVAPGAKRVLVFDDNASSRGILLARLHQFGWRAEGAEDGWSAMRQAALAARTRSTSSGSSAPREGSRGLAGP